MLLTVRGDAVRRIDACIEMIARPSCMVYWERDTMMIRVGTEHCLRVVFGLGVMVITLLIDRTHSPYTHRHKTVRVPKFGQYSLSLCAPQLGAARRAPAEPVCVAALSAHVTLLRRRLPRHSTHNLELA